MSTKHTPGPWTVGNDFNDGVIVGPAIKWPWRGAKDSCQPVAQNIVALVRAGDHGSYAHYSEPMAQANKRLIASAPDLLAALRELESLFDYRGDTRPYTWQERLPMLERARAAIAKAEGGAP
jgi:hypothetical protein